MRRLQLLPTVHHCTEVLPPILRRRRIRLHVIIMSFKRKNDVTPPCYTAGQLVLHTDPEDSDYVVTIVGHRSVASDFRFQAFS